MLRLIKGGKPDQIRFTTGKKIRARYSTKTGALEIKRNGRWEFGGYHGDFPQAIQEVKK